MFSCSNTCTMIGLRAARGHGHGDFSKIGARNFHDGMNGLNFRHERQVGVFLLMRHGNVVQRPPLLLGQHFQDIARGHAAERVKPVFGKMQVVAAGDDLPRAPMQRHGVGQRAVAVENQTLV